MNDNMMYKKLLGQSSMVRFFFPQFKQKEAIILAPHSDDETVGCGGTIQKLAKQGYKITVILMTNGENEIISEGNSENRMAEFQNAMEVLSCVSVIELGYQDGTLEKNFDEVEKSLRKILKEKSPSLIFVPYILDCHSDHKVASSIVANIISDKNILIAMYEVWTPIVYPNYYIDITEFYDKKNRAMKCYQSQERKFRLGKRADGLNRLRADLLMRKNVTYMESFKGFRSDDYMKLIKMLKVHEII